MSIITLTTDWGSKDFYAGAAKGVLLNEMPEANVVDISHQIPPYDIIQGAFVLKNCYHLYPKGTVHIVEVKAQTDKNIVHIAVEANEHFFIGADNGVFSLLLDVVPSKIVELNTSNNHTTFPTRDIYAKAACHLARGGKLDILGQEHASLLERVFLRPVPEEHAIRGSVIYVDNYGNLITNITEELFNKIGKNRQFVIYLRRHTYQIDRLSWFYNEVPAGELLALFNAEGYLEIAINESRANSLLGLKETDIIRIEFK